MSFLLARSPVTPNMARPHGPAIRGSRLSRGSRSGLCVRDTEAGLMQLLQWPSGLGRSAGRLVELGLDTGEQLGPGLLELVDSLVLQEGGHLGIRDSERLVGVLGGRRVAV